MDADRCRLSPTPCMPTITSQFHISIILTEPYLISHLTNLIRVSVSQNMILLPIAIDPHWKWGPMTENFLRLSSTSLQYKFQWDRPHASTMFIKATTLPCPIGIIKSADAIWKTTKQHPFFRYSHTSPISPKPLHCIWNATKKTQQLQIQNTHGNTQTASPLEAIV